MSFELGAKKAGLNLVRAFLHSIDGVRPALPTVVQRRNTINYKFKSYQDGKVARTRMVTQWEEGFPCRGDNK